MTTFPEAVDFAADRERTTRAVAEPARRAQETGQLRPGFVVDDLILMLMAHRGVQNILPRRDSLGGRTQTCNARGNPVQRSSVGR